MQALVLVLVQRRLRLLRRRSRPRGHAAAGDDLRAVVEVDVAEGIHPALGEHALSEDAPLTELLTPVRLATYDDARRADTWNEYDTISLVDVDLPEVVGEVRGLRAGRP